MAEIGKVLLSWKINKVFARFKNQGIVAFSMYLTLWRQPILLPSIGDSNVVRRVRSGYSNFKAIQSMLDSLGGGDCQTIATTSLPALNGNMNFQKPHSLLGINKSTTAGNGISCCCVWHPLVFQDDASAFYFISMLRRPTIGLYGRI